MSAESRSFSRNSGVQPERSRMLQRADDQTISIDAENFSAAIDELAQFRLRGSFNVNSISKKFL